MPTDGFGGQALEWHHLLPSRLASSGRGMLCCTLMDMPLDNIAEPFTEPDLRARARAGLLPAPSQAIFDPRSGRVVATTMNFAGSSFSGYLK